jgi:predicted membrane-bound spermidine synthase
MPFYFAFFLVSGFCAILYELVWLRLAMAQFSVATAFVSIVLSVFMLGLGFGSWRAGRYVEERGARPGLRGLRLYALAELLIGISALLVPRELALGRAFMEKLAAAFPLSNAGYYAVVGILMALTLAPWCAAMGATFPFAMQAIKERYPRESPRSFSYLYLANISGAAFGSIVPLLFIEKLGFLGTLRAGLTLNTCLAASAFALSFAAPPKPQPAAPPRNPLPEAPASGSRAYLWLLFGTGLTTMGVEVVWVRLFTAFLGTVVYAFAAILGTYLTATFIGSKAYRDRKVQTGSWTGAHLTLLGLSMLLLLVACDPRIPFFPLLRVAIGVMPFSAGAGFLTPMWLDRISRGDPARAGRGYAINVVGCVAGPLLAGFILLPLVGERWSLLVFALPWIAAGLVLRPSGRKFARAWQPCAAAAMVLACVLPTRGYETAYSPRRILRDYTATVVAGGRGDERQLLVNGVGITSLTPITKMMAHMPLAFLPRVPKDALVICFGMGTTYRSAMSWGIHSTAVELAPSVPRMFSFFHADGDRLLKSPLSRIVIDDGRFFLERTRDQYDVIVIDPPPPVEAAASSLLYSKEFYAAAKPRLRAGGILAQWLPNADGTVQASVAKALKQSFPYVRVFHSIEQWGWHFLASESPIPQRTAADLAARLPAAAAADLIEWGPEDTPAEQFAVVLGQEIQLDDLIRQNPGIPALSDDRPINEYYLMRDWR